MFAVLLTGGGARGAYQAGVLRALFEIMQEKQASPSIDVFAGMSAGAINSCFCAQYSHKFPVAGEKLVKLWSEVTASKVYRHDVASIGKIGLGWLTDATFGGLSKRRKANYLLDNAPLLDFLTEQLNPAQVEKNLHDGHLKSLVVSAFDYQRAQTVHFIQGKHEFPGWKRAHQRSEKVEICPEHVMASSAIPIVFPSRTVDDHYYGDGNLRNSVPLSPMLQLGADRILVVGVQHPEHMQRLVSNPSHKPSIARMFGLMLNSLFFDCLELDYRRMQNINDLLGQSAHSQDTPALKKVTGLFIRPSVDLGQLAVEHMKQLPNTVYYLLRGLGSKEEAAEVASYLLFEGSYTKKLIEVGYDDVWAQKDSVLRFLEAEV